MARSAEVHSFAVAEWTAERRAYRALLRRKREAFWTSKVESERSSPRQLWRSTAPVFNPRNLYTEGKKYIIIITRLVPLFNFVKTGLKFL